MAVPAFTRFDPRAFLENQKLEGPTAKVAKVAKVDGGPATTFATFATFADGHAEIRNPEPPAEIWTHAHDERAAILDHDGAPPRAWAEGFARLDLSKPPADVPPKRWLRFIDDYGRFLDGGWAARAAALGWGPLDLFGCDRERPFADVDHQGLLWLLNGHK